ncbi:hypothetical protein ABIB90_002343 [Bradyrhizobium sp. JR4.1]|uniref:hypothetical protein n=1 Tax=unclassified Bradyrhizobium TaxID=2631580 RepID=UPI0004805C27|nr:hypothetical protein [Bradyrhizobium sp. WSM1417]
MSFDRAAAVLLAILLFALTLPDSAQAGGEISFEKEYRRIIDIENQVMAQPAYRESKELLDEIERSRETVVSIEERYADAAASDGPEPIYLREAARIRARIKQLERRLAEAKKAVADFREAAEGSAGGRIFPNATHRTAVFTYEDRQGSGLGDAIAFLISKKLLFTAPVHSVAVVNFRNEQLATPAATVGVEKGVTYFDKVDLVTKNQNFGLAIWGRIARRGDGFSIDSFLQVPASASREKFSSSVRIPTAMGGGALYARLRSDRVLIGTTYMDAKLAQSLNEIARQVGNLRRQPKVGAPVVAKLEGLYRITQYQGTWVEILLANGRRGWTSIDQFCTEECRFLLKTADFTNDILALTGGARPRRLLEGLTRDADEMLQQLAVLRTLQDSPDGAANIAKTWIEGSRTPSPTFESLLALAKLEIALKRELARGKNFEDIRLQEPEVQPVVDSLVEASIANPGDEDVLLNLAHLFEFLSDPTRAALARQLASQVTRATP